MSRHEYIFPRLVEIVKGLPAIHIPTFVVGLLALGIIFGVQRFRTNLPACLVAIVGATIVIAVFELHLRGVAIIGAIPGGLPHPIVPPLDFETISSLLGPAVVIALVSFA